MKRKFRFIAIFVHLNTEATLKRVKRQCNTMMLVAEKTDYASYVVTEGNPARDISKTVKVIFDL